MCFDNVAAQISSNNLDRTFALLLPYLTADFIIFSHEL